MARPRLGAEEKLVSDVQQAGKNTRKETCDAGVICFRLGVSCGNSFTLNGCFPCADTLFKANCQSNGGLRQMQYVCRHCSHRWVPHKPDTAAVLPAGAPAGGGPAIESPPETAFLPPLRHSWQPRSGEAPGYCTKCSNPYWNVPVQYPELVSDEGCNAVSAKSRLRQNNPVHPVFARRRERTSLL